MDPSSRKAFTLIELLVVISIVSLLSSVVVSSLNSAREKARIASGLEFAENMQHAYGSNAVGIWECDEGSGSIVSDLSGNGRDGSFVGTPQWTSAGAKKGACSFDGTNYITPPDIRTRYDLVGGQSGKILFMAWIRPVQYGSGGYSEVASNFPGFLYLAVNPSRKLQLMVRDVVNNVNFWPTSTAAIPLNKWTHIAFLLESGVGYKFYIDGKLDTAVSNPNLDLSVGLYSQTRIGASYGAPPNATEAWVGDIDSVRYYYASLD